jgi:hypothetical protein
MANSKCGKLPSCISTLPLGVDAVHRIVRTIRPDIRPGALLQFINYNYHQGKGDSFILKSLYLYMDSLRETFKTFGSSFNVRVEESFVFWYVCGVLGILETEFIKVLKFEIASPIAIFMSNDKPEKPAYPSILGPQLFRFFKQVTRGMGRDRAGSLSMGINNLKRVFPALPVSYRKAMEEKHRSTVSKSPIKIPNFIKKKVERITNEIFSEGWDRNYEPEISFKRASCYEFSRSKGGQLEAWRQELKKYVENVPVVVVSSPEGRSELKDLNYYHDDECERFILRDRYKAKAECVEDPLKIRIITKNERQFGLLKGLQRAMWKHLQNFPSFIFTGTPAAGEYLKYFFSTLDLKSSRNLFISGDYASATDNFVPEISELILETVLRNSNLGSKMQQIALDSITRHIIEYTYVDPVVQNNGQMMGSLLSFPVLCIYNYALWHISMEKYLRTKLSVNWGLKRVLINGDDILFVANKTSYKIWWDTVSKYGLEPSPGKNFSNSRYFTINSMLFKWSYENKEGYSINFPKIQFLYNVNKVFYDKNKKALDQSTLPSLMHGLQKDSKEYNLHPFNEESFMKRLMKKGGTLYNRYDFRGLFIDRKNGGHGLEPLDGTIIRRNAKQRSYKTLYRSGFVVRDYLSQKEIMEGFTCFARPQGDRTRWEKKHQAWVNSKEEQAIEDLRGLIQGTELELRKIFKVKYVTETVAPVVQLRKRLQKNR